MRKPSLYRNTRGRSRRLAGKASQLLALGGNGSRRDDFYMADMCGKSVAHVYLWFYFGETTSDCRSGRAG